LLVALDSSVRELDETFPKALRRFDERLDLTRALLDSTAPEFERLEAISEALLGRTQESEEMLRGQGRRLTEWLESTQGGLEANREKVEALRRALDDAHQGATRITDGAGPLLITALLRVKDTADQAAERARQALGRAIPEAAQALSDASEEAMQRAVGDRVTAQIEQVAKVAEDAVKAAHQASDRLMRQLLTISDTSATIEQRIEEAEQASQTRDRDNFARRSALLIESLNSTAIDVAKLMSNDVTDASWAAYLKGDRGVFTRRAVKLLDAGEAREIAAHYDADADFRDHVNRYIHDFESMLRIILSARDGNALGVAILSSDMGKLYVALAQAIERLRQ
jgi:ABC-type transporter Mla subunit MlaD